MEDEKNGRIFDQGNSLVYTFVRANSEDVITLANADGKETEFVVQAMINHTLPPSFALLRPVDAPEGAEDETLVFRVRRRPDLEQIFELETNDKIIESVLWEYVDLLDEASYDEE